MPGTPFRPKVTILSKRQKSTGALAPAVVMAALAAHVAPLVDPSLGPGVAQLVALVPNSEALLSALAAHPGVTILSRSSFSYLRVPGTTEDLLSVSPTVLE